MVWLHKYWFQGFLIILLQGSLASKGSKEKEKDCANWNKNYLPDNSNRGSKELHLKVACDIKHQLVDIDVVEGTNIIDDNLDGQVIPTVTEVFGYTPSLLVNINMCYWKQNCVISFSGDLLLSCVTVNSTKDSSCAIARPIEEFSETSCVLKKADFIRPISGKCVNNKHVKTIFELKSGKPVPATRPPRRKGLIKSHELYPWNYDKTYQGLTYKYKFKLKRRVLIFCLKFVHVCDGDFLVLRTKHSEKDISDQEENKQLKFKKKDDGFVELEVRIARDSRGCGGFLICYNEVKAKALYRYENGKKNVCDDLIKTIAKLEQQDDSKQ